MTSDPNLANRLANPRPPLRVLTAMIFVPFTDALSDLAVSSTDLSELMFAACIVAAATDSSAGLMTPLACVIAAFILDIMFSFINVTKHARRSLLAKTDFFAFALMRTVG
jgi:ABC-type glucose/galactose transport system permease subunit